MNGITRGQWGWEPWATGKVVWAMTTAPLPGWQSPAWSPPDSYGAQEVLSMTATRIKLLNADGQLLTVVGGAPRAAMPARLITGRPLIAGIGNYLLRQPYA
jgi:hypothetical protein